MVESKFNVKTSIWCNVYHYYCFCLCVEKRQYVMQWHNESFWHTFIDVSLNWSTRCDYVGVHAMIFFTGFIEHTHSHTSIRRCMCALLRWLEGNAMFSFRCLLNNSWMKIFKILFNFNLLHRKIMFLLWKNHEWMRFLQKKSWKFHFIRAARPNEEWQI